MVTLHLPSYIPIVFVFTTLLCIRFLYKASAHNKLTLYVPLLWISMQAVIGLTGFYEVTNTLPPRFILLVAPPLLLILSLFLTQKGRQFIDSFNPPELIFLHIIRIPVELVLFWLASQKTIPDLMTFEGMNPDIISGISAPIVYYFGYVKKNWSAKILLIWNFVCLGLLFNIVIRAALSAPSPFQQLAFDQPNIAILYFPFLWLPCMVVPIVLFSHLICILQLLKSNNGKPS